MTNIVVNTTNINSVVNGTDLEVSVSVNFTNVESIVRVDYGLSDAPADGKIHGRKDGAWVEITQQASGITDILEGTNINIDKTDPENPIINIYEIPTFTDTLITGLKSDADAGGEVPATLYNWFKSVYASLVDSSVKSWIIGIVTQLKWLTDNIGGGGYLLKYEVPVDSTSINLTVDKNGNNFNFTEGDTVDVIFRINKFISNNKNSVNLRVNGSSTNIYSVANLLLTAIIGAGDSYFAQFSHFTFTLYNGEISGRVGAAAKSTSAGNWNINQQYDFKTVGLNSSTVTSINLTLNTPLYPIPAGTIILIIKR